MTEEIIIDVSRCCFYNNGKCDNPNGMACNCINSAVCYFKELKRLEQVNKKLRFIIEKYKSANERLYDAKVDDFNFTLTKYRSALEEIRDYCKFNFVSANPILTKINEVLG